MRMTAAVLVLAFIGCKKHESPATNASAGSGSAVVAPAPPPIDAAVAIDVAIATDATGAAAGDKLGSDVLDKETIGGVTLGDDVDKITKALGKPTKKGKVSTEEATAATVQAWSYGNSTVTVAKVDGKWTAFSIQAVAPSDWKTSRGIHLGSTTVEVQAAYDGELQDDGFLVGTAYGGELFTIKDGKVSEIFLGAMAE